jgi:hypothetical protein
MTPAAQGRHCAACATTVVDFTRMTDAEIMAFLGQSVGTSCGRFRQEQLNRPLLVPVLASPSSWRKRMVTMAALLGLGAAATPLVRAQQAAPVRVQKTFTLGMVAQPAISVAHTLLPPLVVRGVVLDSATHDPLPGVTVMLAGTTTGVSSNKDGAFELTLPEAFREQAQLQVSAIGYKAQQVLIDPQQMEALTVKLVPHSQMLGGLYIVGGIAAPRWYTPRGLWWRISRPFRH